QSSPRTTLSAPTIPLFHSGPSHPRDLHSFPTRRSSDLFGDTVAAWGTMRNLAAGQSFTTVELKANVFAAAGVGDELLAEGEPLQDRKSTRLNSSHLVISYAVFCLKKKTESITGALCLVP